MLQLLKKSLKEQHLKMIELFKQRIMNKYQLIENEMYSELRKKQIEHIDSGQKERFDKIYGHLLKPLSLEFEKLKEYFSGRNDLT